MKRFYKAVAVEPAGDGFVVALDGRRVRSPGKREVLLPTRALADRIAGEWSEQGDRIDPASMPMFGFSATVTDRVAPQRGFVVDEIAGYGGSDLICYRVDEPEDLVRRQREQWDPLHAWAEQALGVRLKLATGVMPVRQDDGDLARLRAAVDAVDDWALAPLHTLTTVSGSLVIGLAVLRGRLDADAGFAVSQLDESYQTEQWGQDREAEQRRRRLREEMAQAAKFIELTRP